MNDRRFVATLNEVAVSYGDLWDTSAARRGDPSALAAWAGFLSTCVERGVSISDERWRQLEVRVRRGLPEFFLPAARTPSVTPLDKDFGVGLTLLIGLLERQSESG